MVARMNELKEKQDPGSTKKEKEGKKAPLRTSRTESSAGVGRAWRPNTAEVWAPSIDVFRTDAAT